jgi:radical SAM superfamily enzyme YgiQ (UPF0313 family)
MPDMILINPKKNALGVFDFLVAKSVPLGLGALAGYLLDKGFSVQLLDEEVDVLTLEKIKRLSDHDRPLFGLGCLTPNVARGYELADMIKQAFPKSTVVFGGIHPTVMPEEVLSYKSVDLVVRGEAEPVIEQIVMHHREGKSFDQIPSCSHMKDGQLVNNPQAPLIDVNLLPEIPYHLFDSKIYDMGFIMSSRGCPFDCSFCSQRAINGTAYRYRSTDKVVNELKKLIALYKPSNIVFFDDIFTIHKKRVYELCQAMIKEGLHKQAEYTMVTRGDCVDEALLTDLKAANFTGLAIGVETANEILMHEVNKGETVQDNINGIRLAKKFGFNIDIVYILGLPGETRADRLAALKMAKSLDVSKARFNNCTPYPGTLLYKIAKEENNLNVVGVWDNFHPTGILTSMKPFEWELPYYPKGCDPKELIMDVMQANMLYFLEPKKFGRLIRAAFNREGTKWLVLPEKWWKNPEYVKGLLAVIVLNVQRLLLLLKWKIQGKLLTQMPENSLKDKQVYPDAEAPSTFVGTARRSLPVGQWPM